MWWKAKHPILLYLLLVAVCAAVDAAVLALFGHIPWGQVAFVAVAVPAMLPLVYRLVGSRGH
jgi:hypothetical protein